MSTSTSYTQGAFPGAGRCGQGTVPRGGGTCQTGLGLGEVAWAEVVGKPVAECTWKDGAVSCQVHRERKVGAVFVCFLEIRSTVRCQHAPLTRGHLEPYGAGDCSPGQLCEKCGVCPPVRCLAQPHAPGHFSPRSGRFVPTKMCTRMFVAALFEVAKIWRSPSCPSTGERLNWSALVVPHTQQGAPAESQREREKPVNSALRGSPGAWGACREGEETQGFPDHGDSFTGCTRTSGLSTWDAVITCCYQTSEISPRCKNE